MDVGWPPLSDKRQEVIDRMNVGRQQSGKPALTPRQEHLVREFVTDEGLVADEDRELFRNLLQSNSV
jgi:hypothetical protein